MTDKVLVAIMKEKSMKFTLPELMDFLDSELSQPPDEMDTDLVELLVNTIGEAMKKECSRNPKLSYRIKQKIQKMIA